MYFPRVHSKPLLQPQLPLLPPGTIAAGTSHSCLTFPQFRHSRPGSQVWAHAVGSPTAMSSQETLPAFGAQLQAPFLAAQPPHPEGPSSSF